MSDAENSNDAAPAQRVIGRPFQPGQSGNPGGKRAIPEWLKGHTDELLRLQLRAAVDGTLPVKELDGSEGIEKVKAAERLSALSGLLDRLLGKPTPADAGIGGLAPVAAALLELARKAEE